MSKKILIIEDPA